MKRSVLLLLLILLSSIGFSQNGNEPESSIIHIIRSNAIIGCAADAIIEFQNQRPLDLPWKTQIDYKIYSTGNIMVTSDWTMVDRIDQVTLNIESNKEYYLFFDKGDISQVEGPEEIQKSFDKIKRKFSYKESLEFPINRSSIVQNKKGPSQGTGFLVNNEGYILTNHHVVDTAESVKVIGIKGEFSIPVTARVVAVDESSDLALLRVESKLVSFEKPPYNLLNSDSVIKAERVFTLGYPMQSAMGSEVKITDGIINSLTGFKNSISEYQISAAVQEGNSGGPLFNSNGELIGIVSAKISSDVADQVGYAIKSNYIEDFLFESGVTQFNKTDAKLAGKELSEQVESISNFVYIIKTN
ncbi:S1C family serine protease [Salibacter halophilus]|uniref:Trypsin-like peptidase domain-containing protein n=1 Tax=Salibacter halophilus TaxID=1803916 RepID=A0A6N6M7E2_9FLAO|nr:serine protease [Salibacter halophilus]KAB1065988.1 trypsin-like peptidase domain-containing protein [Salibacter halophilus]